MNRQQTTSKGVIGINVSGLAIKNYILYLDQSLSFWKKWADVSFYYIERLAFYITN